MKELQTDLREIFVNFNMGLITENEFANQSLDTITRYCFSQDNKRIEEIKVIELIEKILL